MRTMSSGNRLPELIGWQSIRVGLLVFGLFPVSLSAQSAVTIRLTANTIAAGSGGCDVRIVPSAIKNTSGVVQDALIVAAFEDTTWAKAAEPVASLVVLRDFQDAHDVKGTAKADTLLLPVGTLNGRTITVRRTDADEAKSLCSVLPLPVPLAGRARTANRSTQFIADGAIGSVLRGGSSSATTTGSLGIDHLDIKASNERRSFLWLKKIPLRAEWLRALITVASSVDTLASSSKSTFHEALLSPMLAGGRQGSGSVDYQARMSVLSGSTGPRLNFAFARSLWAFVNEDSVIPNKPRDFRETENLTIGSFDARWRWSPLEQLQDPKGNDFAFAVELGYTARWIAGDGAGNDDFMNRTLGATINWFHGIAGSFVITLRQVTATADLPYLLSGPKSLRGVRGLQPVVKMTFAAPMFTF